MLILASSVCGLFKWRQFEPEVILLAIGWYLRFSLSYRDVEELLAERGLSVDHATEPTNDSWRVDETYVRVKGNWVYLLPGGGLQRCDDRQARRLSTRHRRAPSRRRSGRQLP